MGTIRLAVIDDHPLFREGVSRSLSEAQGFVVVGEGADKNDAVRLAEELKPDIVLLDISLPGGGIEAIKPILALCPTIKIIMLTASEDVETLQQALYAGASGYILKGVGSRGLAEAIRTVAAGQSYIAPTLSAKLLARPSKVEATVVESLTAREREVLDMVAQGMVNKMIARHLELQEKTVKHHMTQILMKLGVSNRTEAALRWRDLTANGQIPAGDARHRTLPAG